MSSRDFSQQIAFASQARQEMASLLFQMSELLSQAQSVSENSSDKIELDVLTDLIVRLNAVADNLKAGKFKILVLGEFNRGKSSIINALLKEVGLLPSKMTPCTAILTLIRHGKTKQVTIYYNDDKAEETISFEEFKRNYTIPKEKEKEAKKHNLFPNVDYAVIEHPSKILEDGVEIADSPGLNEDPTKRRDQMVFEYIQKSSAILFILSAAQQFADTEQKYLNEKIQGKNLPVFFLINAWDDIRNRLLDEDDKVAIKEAEQEVREEFEGKLSIHFKDQNNDIDKAAYNRRVFEISALNVLKTIEGKPNTGSFQFPKFEAELGQFLTEDRLIYELDQAFGTALTVHSKIDEIVVRIISILKQPLEKLEERIESIQPLFNQLEDIRDEISNAIDRKKERCAKKVANSYKSYLLRLQDTFQSDFARYEPTLKGTSEAEAKQYCQEAETKFKRYLEDKLSPWNNEQLPTINEYLEEVEDELPQKRKRYQKITVQITRMLTETKFNGIPSTTVSDTILDRNVGMGNIEQLGLNKVGAAGGAGIGAFAGGYVGMTGGAIAGLIATSIPSLVAILPASFLLGIVGIPLAIGTIWGAFAGYNQAKEDFIQAVRYHLIKQLSEIAEDQYDSVYDKVAKIFDGCYSSNVNNLSEDILSQKQLLNNSLEQRKNKEIDLKNEEIRLEKLQSEVNSLFQEIQQSYLKYTDNQL